jgi:hypothetical protein
VKLLLSLIEGLMGLGKEHSVSQLFLLNEGFYSLKPDQMGEALILPNDQ